MSHKDHETLQSISEDLLQGNLVKESLSPYDVPALLVPKKDRSCRICIDSQAINKITVKYRFSILRLEDMLDKYQVLQFSLN